MAEKKYSRLRPEQAHAWLAEHPDALVLDAREARHHAISHLAGCTRLDGRNHESLLMREPKNRPVFIYCYHGNASQTYASMFKDFGFAEVADLIGGWMAIDRLGQLQGPQQPGDVLPVPLAMATTSVAEHISAVPPALAAWLAAEGFDPNQPELACVNGEPSLMRQQEAP